MSDRRLTMKLSERIYIGEYPSDPSGALVAEVAKLEGEGDA